MKDEFDILNVEFRHHKDDVAYDLLDYIRINLPKPVKRDTESQEATDAAPTPTKLARTAAYTSPQAAITSLQILRRRC